MWFEKKRGLVTGMLGADAGRVRRLVMRQVGLMTILGVTKQSLNRVLRQLLEEELVLSATGRQDRRQRNLYLTPAGDALERELSQLQRERVRRAYRAAGPEAVAGFRQVLEQMIDDAVRDAVRSLVAQDGP